MKPFWNLQKITIFFRTPNLLSPDSWNFPKFPWHGFCMTANVMRKSEDIRQAKMEGTCCGYSLLPVIRKLLSSNTKEYIQWVICGATVSLLFWLFLESQSFKIVRKFTCRILFFKIVRKFICPILCCSLLAGGDVSKPKYCLLPYTWLFFIIY